MKATISNFIKVTLIILLHVYSLQAQEVRFSQWYQTPLIINPALTGAFNGSLRAVINYRNFQKDYNTIAGSYEMAFMKKKWKRAFIGAGLNLFNDNEGPLTTKKASFSLAFHRMINRNNALSVGLQSGYAQKSITTINLVTNTMNSNTDLSNNHSGYGDFSYGLLWTWAKDSLSNKFNIGFSQFNINRPMVTLLGVNEKESVITNAHASVLIKIKRTKMAVAPNILFVHQGSTQEILPGLFFQYTLEQKTKTMLFLGGQYRNQDSFIATAFFEYTNYALGISYDLNTGNLGTENSKTGVVELSLRYINRRR